MEFRILGPLEVVEDGIPVALGTLKGRLVLGVLLLHANELVSRERLVDDLWGEAPPPTAHRAVSVYISQLRKALDGAGDGLIAAAPGGYRLEVDPERLDAERARRLVARARACVARGELERAVEQFHEAVSLWRGSTLAGLPFESRGNDEVAQLDELRLGAVVDRIDCDLALGRHEQVVGELNVLVREHPLHERLRAQQMLALYRAERQTDALYAYAAARETLVDGLGIEPSEGLQRLQQAILRHDPALESPEGTVAANGVPPSSAPPPRRTARRRRLVAVAVLGVAAAAAVAAVVLSRSPPAPRVIPNSLVRLDPRTGKPTLVVPVGVEPGPIEITRSAIWTSNYGDNTVSRYDLRTHKVEARAGFPAQPFDTVVDGDGNAWITSSYEDNAPAQNAFLTRLEAGPGGTSPGTLYPSHAQTIDLPLPMAGYEALGAGYLWVIVGGHGPLLGDDRLALVDLASSRVASVLHLQHATTSIAFGYGAAWVGTYTYALGSWLEAIRAGSTKPKAILLQKPADWGPVSIAVGEGSVWVIAFEPSGLKPTLFQIDPQTLQIRHRLDLSALRAGAVAAGAGAVWVTGGIAGTGNSVTEVDPRTDTIIRTTPLGNKTRVTCGIAATDDAVWVTLGNRACDTIGR